MNIEPEEKKKFSLITFWSVIAILAFLGIIATIAEPFFVKQANNRKQTEAKQTLAAMNKSQQAYYTENNRFLTTMADFTKYSGAGIKTQTVNYTYDVVGVGKNVVNLAKPGNSALLGYAGGVGLVTPIGTTDKTSTSILCQGKTPGVMPDVVFTDSEVKCADPYNYNPPDEKFRRYDKKNIP